MRKRIGISALLQVRYVPWFIRNPLSCSSLNTRHRTFLPAIMMIVHTHVHPGQVAYSVAMLVALEVFLLVYDGVFW